MKTTPSRPLPESVRRCRRRFLKFFPKGFQDAKYDAWERGYKEGAHEQWEEVLNKTAFRALLRQKKYKAIAAHAVRIESRTNLLFSFEKMAVRDAVKSRAGAKRFAEGLYDFLHGPGTPQQRFERWRKAIDALPRRQTRVLTWPVVTVFGFIAQPRTHLFLKPTVTRAAARKYGVELPYASKPDWAVYSALLGFARRVRRDLRGLHPKDMIDIQSFLWTQGSSEYA